MKKIAFTILVMLNFVLSFASFGSTVKNELTGIHGNVTKIAYDQRESCFYYARMNFHNCLANVKNYCNNNYHGDEAARCYSWHTNPCWNRFESDNAHCRGL